MSRPLPNKALPSIWPLGHIREIRRDMLAYFTRCARECGDGISLRDAAAAALAAAEERGLYALDPLPELALPRLFELVAAVNRLRSLRVDPLA